MDKKPTKGCSDRLISMALPTASNKQMVTRASLPKLPIKNVIGLIGLPLKLYGKIKNRLTIVARITKPVVSIGIQSRENI